MITYGTEELISSSELSKKFGTYLTQIKNHTVDKLAILKNNKVEAVLISKDEYESMKEALKQLEAREILTSMKKGLKEVKEGKVYSIDTLWNQIDD